MKINLNEHGVGIETALLQAGGVVLAQALKATFSSHVLHVLQGSNGVGKSTLLRTMAQHLHKQAFLLVAPFGLRDELTVLDQLQVFLTHFPQQLFGLDLDQLLERVGLLDWSMEQVGVLSAGQRTRLALCVLVASPFRVWLLDEPHNALDVEGRALLASLIEQHLQKGGLVIMTSHDNAVSLLSATPLVPVQTWQFAMGRLSPLDNPNIQSAQRLEYTANVVDLGQTQSHCTRAVWKRECLLLKANPQHILWGGLFHWMVISFFGLSVFKSDIEFAQAAIWVSMLLSLLLVSKDWFVEDHRVGWLAGLYSSSPVSLSIYWSARCGMGALLQLVALLPISLLAGLQFDLNAAQLGWMAAALACGILACAPLLGLISLMVMLTRGGTVLVYILALPLMVPILIFGLEASQASHFGRPVWPPFAVLLFLGALTWLLAPGVAKKLIQLIQE